MMRIMLVAFCLVSIIFSAMGQPLSSSNWYFGQRAGITFRNGSVEAMGDGQLNTSEGCASISDPLTGELLFYTDGVTVWNRLHDIMPNGTGLYGDPSTSQSALVVPAPGKPDVFYIFNPAPITTANLGVRCLCLYYSIVDMRSDAGFGDVVKKNEILLNDITEHLTASADCKGDGWWVVVRSRSTRHFFSLHISRDEVGPIPVVSDAGNPTLAVRDVGQMHISPDSRKLVITSASGNSQLYDFDAQTGKVSNAVNLFKVDVLGSHYGAAFSLDSRKLYVAVSSEDGTTPARVYQFSLDAQNASDVANSKYLMGELPGVFTWVPMQSAQDGRIYIGRPGQPWLAMIESPGMDSSLAGLRDTALRLTGACRLGLPNYIGSMFIPPGSGLTACSLPRANFSNKPELCNGGCLSFRDKSLGIAESWQWKFEGGSPATSVERDPQRVCYSSPGIYSISLVVSNSIGSDTANSFVQVWASPSITTDSVAEICPGSTVRLQARGAERYEWSPPSLVSDPFRADPTVRPRSTTRFTVVGTNVHGCKDTSSVLVRVVSMTASDNVTICSGASTQLVAQGADRYLWTPSTGLDDSTSSSPVATPRSTTQYVVSMERGSCIVLDTVVVSVVDSFDVQIIGPTRTCIGDTLVLSASAGTWHEWSGIGVLDHITTVTRVVMGTSPAIIRLVSRSGGCQSIDSIIVQPVQGPAINLGNDVQVCAGETTVLTATSSAIDITWSPSQGLDVTSGSIVRCRPTISTRYIASAVGDSGCIGTDTIVVEVIPLPFIEAGADLSVCLGGSIQIEATGNAERFEWTPAAGLSSITTLRPIASPARTTTYVLRALTGRCEAFDSITVYVSVLDLRVSADTSICIGEFVLLQASGAARYVWTPTQGLNDPQRADPIATPVTTTTYTVQGSDQIGCTQARSVTVTVQTKTPIRLIVGSVTADAGTDGLGLPIIIEVPQSLLPLTIKEIRATLVHDATVYLPDSTDRGALRTSVRGNHRLSYLLLENIQVVSPRQKITEVRGTVLAGKIETAPMWWEDVSWDGPTCPSITPVNGILYITGCNITGRALRTFASSSVTVRPLSSQNGIEVLLGAYQPGDYVLRLYSVDGRLVWSTSVTRNSENGEMLSFPVDLTSVSSGIYSLTVSMPTAGETIPVIWFR